MSSTMIKITVYFIDIQNNLIFQNNLKKNIYIYIYILKAEQGFLDGAYTEVWIAKFAT